MIDTEHKLAAILLKLQSVDWLALDTEADSLHAYPEKLCLIQVSHAGGEELIDPLAPQLNLKPLLAELQRHELIMHGADYDLRLMRKSLEFVPSTIFDTMLASRLLGSREFGLNSLVLHYLGVHLEKGPQKANWAQRPLTPRMEAYARNDTHYLKPLSDILRAQLKEKGRIEWHRETCQSLIEDCAQIRPTDPDVVWRVKGSHRLNPRGLGVLRELWRWRESEAIARNKPPYFILSPETMVDLSEAAVSSLAVRDILPRHLSPHRREGVMNAIQAGLELKSHPEIKRSVPYRQTESEKKRMLELEKWRNERAAALGIEPTLIASRAMLVMLARNWDAHQNEMMRWQRELLQP
ncbi:MAG TPA: HRDC domain-containing protein [Verrucomicrobiae bacterium]